MFHSTQNAVTRSLCFATEHRTEPVWTTRYVFMFARIATPGILSELFELRIRKIFSSQKDTNICGTLEF